MSSSDIYYLVPDSDHPSWGVGLLYGHVRLLRRCGYNATILHHGAPFRPSWMTTDDVPVHYLDSGTIDPKPSDFLIVPEVLAREASELSFRCRRVVFVQGSYLILSGLGDAESYQDLGFEFAMAVLPHVREVLENHFRIEAELVPPFVAPDFFSVKGSLPQGTRRRRILLHVKKEYRAAGMPDYEIFNHLWRRHADPSWELQELAGLSHLQVAETMVESAFLVNLNCLEAFNTTVPEAMATGCIPICYEGYGGQDFLSHGDNAFVFPNNYVYPLAAQVFDLMDRFDLIQQELQQIRRSGQQTARLYTQENTQAALEALFRSRLS